MLTYSQRRQPDSAGTRVLASTSLTCLMLLMQCGCTTSKSAEAELLESLKKNPLFATNGVDTMALGPSVVALTARDAAGNGIDLWKLYMDNRSDAKLRLQLAYLLIMSSDQAYVTYAESHYSECESDGQFRLWTYILDSGDANIPVSYALGIEHILSAALEPSAQLYTIRKDVSNGMFADALARCLCVLARNDRWGYDITPEMQKIAKEERVSLLQPYLKSQTPRGVYAAMGLAMIPMTRDGAMEYLNRCVQNPGVSVARSATRALEYLDKATSTQPTERK